MQIMRLQSLQGLALAFLLSCGGTSLASDSPESNVYTPSEIHHYRVNGGAPTVTIFIVAHYRFENGKYVWIPAHNQEAPLPHNKDRVAVWDSPHGSTPGHWIKNENGHLR